MASSTAARRTFRRGLLWISNRTLMVQPNCGGDLGAIDAADNKDATGTDEDGRYYVVRFQSEAYELKKARSRPTRVSCSNRMLEPHERSALTHTRVLTAPVMPGVESP